MKTLHQYLKPLMLVSLFSGLIAPSTHATPYNGTAPTCPSSTSTTCSIDLLDFMKSSYSYTYQGNTYTFDGSSKDSAANQSANSAFISVPKLMYYKIENNQGQWVDMGSWGVNAAFFKHPSQPNVLVFSKNGAPGDGLEFFRWGNNPDNSMFVLSEPPSETTYLFKSFGTILSAPAINWRYRGYLWYDKKFDVTSQGNGIWIGPRYSNLPSSYYNKYNKPNGEMIGSGEWHLNGAKQFKYINYYPSLSASWINEYGGQLPTPLEILEVMHGVTDSNGQVVTWEKFYYGRQKLSNGTYNNFGLIKWQNAHVHPPFTTLPKCVNGVPPAAYPSAKCGDFDLMIMYDEPYNIFRRANQSGYSNVSSYLNVAFNATSGWKNDVKMTKRSAVDPSIAPAPSNAASALPHLRGGFVPPGNGNDARGTPFIGNTDWVYLENSLSDQDWYLYPAGKDPLFAPQASPTNYCRDGYQYLGSMAVSKSYSGLTGQIESAGPHWIILCGTSRDAYLNGMNNGEPSCTNGYTNRTWFENFSHQGIWGCAPGQACFDLSAKNYVNFCVKNTQCAGGACNPTPYP